MSVDAEESAWIWLGSQADADPADCTYGADDMVDAFLAGRASSWPYDAERLAAQHAEMRQVLRWYAGDGSTFDGIDVGQRARQVLERLGADMCTDFGWWRGAGTGMSIDEIERQLRLGLSVSREADDALMRDASDFISAIRARGAAHDGGAE